MTSPSKTTGSVNRASWSSPPVRLSQYLLTPDRHGVYEIGVLSGVSFIPRYLGRAWKTTIRDRLYTHYRASHNPAIRQMRETLYCRWITTERLPANVAESFLLGVSSSLDLEKTYPWNRRMEWKAYWDQDS